MMTHHHVPMLIKLAASSKRNGGVSLRPVDRSPYTSIGGGMSVATIGLTCACVSPMNPRNQDSHRTHHLIIRLALAVMLHQCGFVARITHKGHATFIFASSLPRICSSFCAMMSAGSAALPRAIPSFSIFVA